MANRICMHGYDEITCATCHHEPGQCDWGACQEQGLFNHARIGARGIVEFRLFCHQHAELAKQFDFGSLESSPTVHLVIVSPCPEGFAVTKYGAGAINVQPCFDKTWKKRDIERALKNIYPRAQIKHYQQPVRVEEREHFGAMWRDLVIGEVNV